MKRGSPDRAGWVIGAALAPLGVAQRFSAEDGAELWRLPAGDVARAERLAELASHGLFGFEGAGVDDDGPWLVRGSLVPTLRDWHRSGRRVDARSALDLVLGLARTLAHAEAHGLDPGRLTDRSIVRSGDGWVLLAEELLARELGAPVVEVGSDRNLRWWPPEHEGDRWTAADRRYALGLVAYEIIAGEPAFGGQGLRLALDERARYAPPLPDDVAADLPPGVQSALLSWIDPDAALRPRDAESLVRRLEELTQAAPARKRRSDPVITAERVAAPSAVAAPRRAPTRSRSWGYALGALCVALGLWLALRAGATPHRTALRAPALPAVPSASDCASCHPRQAGEWRRSVMAHATTSPLYQSLEMLIEEQIGRDQDCPDGAGILRRAGTRPCRDSTSGVASTGSGGELWCVNCHAPSENLAASLPPWESGVGGRRTRAPLADLLGPEAREGISCTFCHSAHGPAPRGAGGGRYAGNPTWVSTRTGALFFSRPEDRAGVPGISNSGYDLDVRELLAGGQAELVPGGAHARPSDAARSYLRSSEFCGACHDVRLFGTDVIGARRGEHFKRLRDAYSEWAAWRDQLARDGRSAASCQDCHMSRYPGRCVRGSAASPGAADRACPEGTHFEPDAPGTLGHGFAAVGGVEQPLHGHQFAGIDVPLSDAFPAELMDEPTLDVDGVPLGARQRRDLLLARALRLEVGDAARRARRLELPVTITNVGAGHRVPAGFSQEREIWLELTITDARGALVYQVGHVDRADADLADKRFVRVSVDEDALDGRGRPIGLFGADVVDGPDVPRWDPPPERGAADHRGLGLVSFQNGFLRCVICLGRIDSDGACQPLPGQERARADRFADGDYDTDTGECRSNLSGDHALFETYFPVGALDATRGVIKAPDAIISTRSLAPDRPVRFVYDLSLPGAQGALSVRARLLFRAFPPYLLRAFAAYEARAVRAGRRPSGPLLTERVLDRLEVVEIARVELSVP